MVAPLARTWTVIHRLTELVRHRLKESIRGFSPTMTRAAIHYGLVRGARSWTIRLQSQKRSINRGNHARGVQRDRLDLDAHDLSLLRFLEHRVERVRLGPAACRRVDSVRNGSPRVDGSFGHVRIDPQV